METYHSRYGNTAYVSVVAPNLAAAIIYMSEKYPAFNPCHYVRGQRNRTAYGKLTGISRIYSFKVHFYHPPRSNPGRGFNLYTL